MTGRNYCKVTAAGQGTFPFYEEIKYKLADLSERCVSLQGTVQAWLERIESNDGSFTVSERRNNNMRYTLLISISVLGLSLSCGGEPETEILPDSTATTQQDTVQIQEVHHTSPQDAITGAYNLIDEAQSVTDQANERTEELQQMMGDM